jgi:ADP-ribose pyrophosphatase YjhB (NUDIX family)
MDEQHGMNNQSRIELAGHDAATKDPPIIAVGGVVYRHDKRGQVRLLLIKKRNGFWTLPKGRVKPGEDATAAVAREIAEETGISGPVERVIHQVTYTIEKRRTLCRKIVTYYLVCASGGKPCPDKKEGIEKVRWFRLDAALQRIGRDRVRAVVGRAADLLQDCSS